MRVSQVRLDPGQVHVITERSFGAGEGEREKSGRAGVRAPRARGPRLA